MSMRNENMKNTDQVTPYALKKSHEDLGFMVTVLKMCKNLWTDYI